MRGLSALGEVMVRVLHIAKVIQIAGAEQHLLTLLPALRAAGVDVHMLVIEKSPDLSSSFVEELEQAGVPVKTIAAPPGASLLNSSAPGFVWQVSQQIRALNPDIV